MLRLEPDVADPVPSGRQVLIDVEACALNFADDLICRGTYQDKPGLPLTPGLEVCGTVAAAGPDAHHQAGQRVAGSTLLPHGGLAERCTAESSDVFTVPVRVSSVDAAAMHVTYQTAWFALYRRAALRPGDTLLVHAAAGGAGSAAVQIGKAAGAYVIATAGGAEKVQRCLDLGADIGIDHRAEDFVDRVNDITDGNGADVIFDPVGGDTFDRSRRCVAWEGRILVIGAASGRYVDAPTNHVLVKNYSIVGVHWGGYRSRDPELVHVAHADLMRLHQEGAVAPLISRVVGLGDALEALTELTAGRTTGKLVVEPHR